MLTKLIATSWQCHRSLAIELGPVTVLCADNDKGKSALLRLIKWICLNEWDGEANTHVSWGENFSEGTLVVDGHSITRRKGKEENAYLLDGKVMKAFRDKVPQVIADLLRLGPDNFQNQSDPAFWLTLTGGNAASALNEIFHLSEIDDATANIGSEVRKAKARVGVSEERLEQAEKAKKELAWTKQANKDLKELEVIEERIEEMKTEERELEERFMWLEEAETIKEGMARTVDLLDEVIHLGEESLKVQEQIGSLTKLIELEEKALWLKKQVKEKESKLTKSLAGTCPLCGRAP